MPSSDIVALLLKDHRDAERQLEEFGDAGMTLGPDRFKALAESLVRHEVAEEAVLYPVLRLAPGGAAIAEARLREQSEAIALVSEMEQMDPQSDEFAGAFADLRSSMSEHAFAEEAFVLPLLASHGQRRLLRRMGRLYLRVKNSVADCDGFSLTELADRLRENAPELRRRRVAPEIAPRSGPALQQI